MAKAEASGASRRRTNWEARRQAIIDTSAKVFARQGYHATGITELCAANELGKGALYHYIGSKEELLAAIHDRVMDEVMLGAERVAAAGRTTCATLLGGRLLSCWGANDAGQAGQAPSAAPVSFATPIDW